MGTISKSRQLNFQGDFSLVLALIVLVQRVSCENFTVGYLANLNGRSNTVRQGLIISGAMSYALEVINENTTLLKDHKLHFIYNDTFGETLAGTRAIMDQWRSGVIAFFGPDDSCDVEATVAASINLPMISYKCTDSKVSQKDFYSTFARTYPPEKRVVRSVIALLSYYNWHKFTIVCENIPLFLTVAQDLEQESRENFTLNTIRTYDNSYICCEDNRDCCGKEMLQVVDETYKGTRVYVFIGNTQDLVTMMMVMRVKGLLANGEYVVIFIDFESYKKEQSYYYFWPRTGQTGSLAGSITLNEIQAGSDAARSLLVIVPSPPQDQAYNNFEEKVREYNQKEPFNFTEAFPQHKKHITVFASYLYDAVMLYAQALDDQLKHGGDPRNGTAIIQNIISRKRYRSITGTWMQMDQNGDAEGNYTVLARLPVQPSMVLKGNSDDIHLNYTMLPVGSFHYNEKSNFPVFKLQTTIDWIGGNPPPDEPPCGFDGSQCKAPPDKNREIAASVLASILVVVSLIAIITYRNWKYEQEIAGLLWRIDIREIKRGIPDGLMGYLSRVSLGSQHSVDSKIFTQLFATTAMYKGTWVAVKELSFGKKTGDISRETKIEMKTMREMHQDNINPFIGACVEPTGIYMATEYCAKGSLLDILGNENYKLDNMFISSLVFDLLKGMIYLHDSDLKVHGNLKSSNCLVTSRWVLQVSDFGLHELRSAADPNWTDENQFYKARLWLAPELLRQTVTNPRGTVKGDIYAFAIILHEIITRMGPFGSPDIAAKDIIEKVKYPSDSEEPFRPELLNLECQDFVLNVMKECWHERPDFRPDFRHVRDRLNKMRDGMKSNIMDNMISMMEKYANNLEDLVDERTAQLEEEKKKTEALLHRMLPKSVAEELMRGEAVIPESFDAVTIYFSDIVGFTEMSASSSPMEVVGFLNDLYTLFDDIIGHYEVYKVETIGDAYMVASGLPRRNGDKHSAEIASMALELLDSVKTFRIRHRPNQTLKLRIGIHTGPVVAGVVGLTMPRYCLFGDTVNTASRMESNGEALKIHVSTQCRDYLEKLGGYVLEERGLVKMKGKGDMRTYWLQGHTTGPNHRRDNKDAILPQPLFAPVRDSETRCRRSPKLSISELPRRCSLAVRHDQHGGMIPGMDDSNSTLFASAVSPGHGPPGVPAFLRVYSQDSPQTTRLGPAAYHRIQNIKDTDKNSASCGDIPTNPGSRALYDIKEKPNGSPPKPNGRVVVDPGTTDSDTNTEDECGLRFKSDKPRNGFVPGSKQTEVGQALLGLPLTSSDLSPVEHIVTPNEGTWKEVNGKNHLRAPLLPTLDAKRWRSCDEINSPKPKSLKTLFTGLFTNKLLDLEHRRGSNISMGAVKIRIQDHGESVV